MSKTPEFIRVRDKRTGAHLTVTPWLFKRHEEHYQALKTPGADVNGRPLPPTRPAPLQEKTPTPDPKGK